MILHDTILSPRTTINLKLFKEKSIINIKNAIGTTR